MVRCEPWDEWNVFRMMHSKMYGRAEMVFHAHIYMYSLCVDLNVHFSYMIQIIYSPVP